MVGEGSEVIFGLAEDNEPHTLIGGLTEHGGHESSVQAPEALLGGNSSDAVE